MAKAYTSLEQSHKLAEILPIESADQIWERIAIVGANLDVPEEMQYRHNGDISFVLSSRDGVPCWSLAALLGLVPKGEGKDLSLVFGSYDGGYHPLWFCTYEETPTILEICSSDNPIDACVEMIYKLKEKDLL